jgi:type I restriction enzyme S subunit
MPFTESEIEKCTVRKGDLLVCEGGDIGRSAIWLFDDEIRIQNHIHRLRSYIELSNRFYYYVMYLWKRMERIGGQGIGLQGFSSKALHKLIVPLPPVNEQFSVVEKLDSVLGSVDALDELNAEFTVDVECIKKQILDLAIQGKLVPQIDTEEPATILLEQIRAEKLRLLKEGKLKKKDIQDSVIFKDDDNRYYEKVGKVITDITEDLPFEIPDSWQWSRLSNIANLYTGNSINEAEKNAIYTNVQGTEYIATKDVKFDNSIDYQNGVAIPNQYVANFRIAPAKSVLMCIEGGSAGRKIGILDQEVCFGNKLCCFAPYTDISEYIFYYLQSPLFFEIFSSNKNGIIGGVSVNNLKQLFIPLPPLNEINRIVNKIKAISKSIEG